jgi:hypothetical protein
MESHGVDEVRALLLYGKPRNYGASRRRTATRKGGAASTLPPSASPPSPTNDFNQWLGQRLLGLEIFHSSAPPDITRKHCSAKARELLQLSERH